MAEGVGHVRGQYCVDCPWPVVAAAVWCVSKFHPCGLDTAPATGHNHLSLCSPGRHTSIRTRRHATAHRLLAHVARSSGPTHSAQHTRMHPGPSYPGKWPDSRPRRAPGPRAKAEQEKKQNDSNRREFAALITTYQLIALVFGESIRFRLSYLIEALLVCFPHRYQ